MLGSSAGGAVRNAAGTDLGLLSSEAAIADPQLAKSPKWRVGTVMSQARGTAGHTDGAVQQPMGATPTGP
jgi:hypothetical protein